MKLHIIWWCLVARVICVSYICEEHSTSKLQTDNYYPHTIVPDNVDIPVTLGVNNYIFKEDHSDMIFHDIDVKVLDTYFDALYVAYPAKFNSSSIFQSRYRDNLNNVFRIRYSTFPDASCIGSNLIQFKMVFLKNDSLYEYYFGNCNSSEVFYEGFDEKSLCIPMEFSCLHEDKCASASYNFAKEQAESVSPELITNDEVVITGSFPSRSAHCLDGGSCQFSRYSTKSFHFADASYTPVIIDTVPAAAATASSESLIVAPTTTSSSSLALAITNGSRSMFSILLMVLIGY